MEAFIPRALHKCLILILSDFLGTKILRGGILCEITAHPQQIWLWIQYVASLEPMLVMQTLMG